MSDPVTNTTDQVIADPADNNKQIVNPDYVKPVPTEPVQAASAELELAPKPELIGVGRTGNNVIDAVGNLLIDNKVKNADDIISTYAETGEVSLAHKVQLAKELGDATAQLVVNQLESEATKLVEANTSARTTALEYANKLFGGQNADTTWKEIQAYVKDPESGFSADEVKELSTLIRAGGYGATVAFDKIHAVYSGDSNTTSHADLLAGDTLAQGNNFEPLTAKDYSRELSKLAGEFGYESTQVRALQNRRDRSRSQGI